MARSDLQSLLNKPITRKEFLGIGALTVASLFGIGGLVRTLSSHAATPAVSVEPENGVTSAGANSITDAAASDGRAIRFEDETTTQDNPFRNRNLYNSPTNAKASKFIDSYTAATPVNYDLGNNVSPYPGQATAQKALNTLDAIPQAQWFSGNKSDATDMATLITGAKNAKQLPLILLYNIPNRDNGSYSAGGAANQAAYETWINTLITAKTSVDASYPAACIIEPDSIAELNAIADPTTRKNCLQYAAQHLTAAGFICYLDAGNTQFTTATYIMTPLIECGIQYVRGFSSNIANFQTLDAEITYGNQIAAELSKQGYPDKHHIIDCSRNGNGPWTTDSVDKTPQYNPPGRSGGVLPSAVVPGGSLVQDACLYIKTSIYTDAAGIRCPASGGAFPDYVVDMLPRSAWFTDFTTMPSTMS